MYVLFVVFTCHESANSYTHKFVAENKKQAEAMANEWLFDELAGFLHNNNPYAKDKEGLKRFFSEESFYNVTLFIHEYSYVHILTEYHQY